VKGARIIWRSFRVLENGRNIQPRRGRKGVVRVESGREGDRATGEEEHARVL